jgi:hypothetical protein
VVAEQADVALHRQVDAFARVRPVADNVAQAVDLRNPLLLDIGQDGLEAFEVAMNVADDRAFHTPRPSMRQYSIRPACQGGGVEPSRAGHRKIVT